jgi:hypothetical protein
MNLRRSARFIRLELVALSFFSGSRKRAANPAEKYHKRRVVLVQEWPAGEANGAVIATLVTAPH